MINLDCASLRQGYIEKQMRKSLLESKLLRHQSLKEFNTLAIDAFADYFFTFSSLVELQDLMQTPMWGNLSKLFLGEGSNILFVRDFKGLVLKSNITGIKKIREDEKHIWLRVGGGENWHRLVMRCIAENYAGIENLVMIPGAVGAAPIQNIGSYGVELKDCLSELNAVRISDGKLLTFTNEMCEFGYRDSIFKKKLKGQYIIIDVTLRLNKKPQFHLDYGSIRETLRDSEAKEITIKTIAEAIMHIRQNKLPDPRTIPNAGSFFSNPILSQNKLSELQVNYPHIPHYEMKNQQFKIPAAWFIEQSGWKGKCLGQAGVHDKHAVVLVNYGETSGADVLELANEITKDVYNKFQVKLVPEVRII